jgi:Bacterial Ig-like domain (group 3)
MVTFIDGATTLGSAPLRGGKARLSTSTLPIGRDVIQAVYAGASTVQPSTSAARIETVLPDRSTTELAAQHVGRQGGDNMN